MNRHMILVVEDEQTIQSLCKRILDRIGQEAVFLGTIASALAKINELGQLDLLITDIRLPDGDGRDVIHRVRERFPAAKVLVITGSPASDLQPDDFQALNVPESDILFKPFEASCFEAAVQCRLTI